MTSFNLTYLLKALFPNTVEDKASTYEFCGDTVPSAIVAIVALLYIFIHLLKSGLIEDSCVPSVTCVVLIKVVEENPAHTYKQMEKEVLQ